MKTSLFTDRFSDKETKDYHSRTDRLRAVLASAEAVLIGAGAGLSTAAGLKYAGKEFEEYFADFIEKFGITDLYSSSFYPYPSEETRWAYWAKHVEMIRFAPPAMPLYLMLADLVKGKEYFVITTNVDSQFRKAGFAPERIFEVQGDYGLMQCRRACHPKLYSDYETVKAILPAIRDCSIPSALVPVCPVCGGPMDIHVRTDASFIQDEAWNAMADRYERFLADYGKGRIVFLEIGVGFNTPSIIRYPFERMTYANPQSTLVRLNREFPQPMPENKERCIPFSEPAEKVIADILQPAATPRA